MSNVDYGKAVRVAIAIRGVKKKDLAAEVGVTPQQVSNWISSGVISQRRIHDVAAALGFTVSELIALGEESQAAEV